MQSPVNVAVVGDENVLRLIEVLAASIAAHASPDRSIHLHVIYSGPDTQDLERLAALRFGPLTTVIHRVDNPLAELGALRHLTPATFLRFAVPEVLKGLERAIYIDCDMLVLADIGRLFDVDLGGKPIGAVVDIGLMVRRNSGWRSVKTDDFTGNTQDYLARLLPEVDPARYDLYVNGGLQVMDLAALRRLDHSARTSAYVSQNNTRLHWRDQDTLNRLYFDDICRIDPRWNVQTSSLLRRLHQFRPGFQRDTVVKQRKDPWIVHFTGKAKPWTDSRRVPYAADWWLFARHSSAYAEIRSEWRDLLLTQRKFPLNQPGPLTWWRRRQARRRLADALASSS